MAEKATDLQGTIAALLGAVRRDVDVSRRDRIFCNRNLRLDSVEVIGFDMDYTLALYHQERLEELSIRLTLEKLISKRGYPPEIISLDYNPAYAIRGIVIDATHGNVFKMDRHGYVGRVFHGRKLLDKDERIQIYRQHRIRLSSPRYHWIDTLFALPEAVMFMSLVDYFDERGGGPGYEKIFTDIRASIDESHADDTLKSVVRDDLAGFLKKDSRLAETLHKLRSSGKKLFVLTNSLWPYTNVVMSYLLDGERQAYPSWRNYFDYVLVGARKPAFFAGRAPFLHVDQGTGEPTGEVAKSLSRDGVFQAGNIIDFEEMVGVRGDRVLYVGDHIYGDMIRLKKSHTWRTVLVLQELALEHEVSEKLAEEIRDLSLLDRRRRNLESEIDYQVLVLKQIQRLYDDAEASNQLSLDEARRQVRDTLDSLRNRCKMIREEVTALEESLDRTYNPFWGAMFREGNENSRFGQQVQDYADLYTSRASNFFSYSPLRYFRAPRKRMPHEL